MNTDTQQEFIRLVKEKETLEKQIRRVNFIMTDIMKQLPMGEMFQEPETGVVYQIIIPAGRYMEYRTIDYIRTRKSGEKIGTLSIKAAEEAGFVLKEEEKK